MNLTARQPVTGQNAANTSQQDDLTVFVVDDDPDIRRSLTRALQKRDYLTQAYDSGLSFLEEYDGTSAGCLVLDHGMPGMTGLELQAHLVDLDYPLAIIFVTGHGGVPESVQAIKNGAIDFLEKPFRQSVLLERIEAAFAVVREKLAHQRAMRQNQALFDRLTAREQEIVQLIISNPSEVSSKEVGNALGISPRTVDHHRARILEKLRVKSVAQLIALANGTRPAG